ncbi:MAG: chloride channel protein, partial [Gemmatimonadales bacterium]|nr:chloride channel protein [Gemmatimonadales bacterium]
MRQILWLLALPALVGAVAGAGVGVLAGTFEDTGLDWLNHAPGYTAALVSLLALPATFAVVRLAGLIGRPSGAELYIHTYHEPPGRLPLREIPARILAAITTVGLGGSQGFEAASALLGSSLADATSRWRLLAIPPEAARSLITAGASGGIAAVFSSPAVGLLYGLEVPFRRDLDAPRLVPATVASACAYAARVAVAGAHPLIEVRELPSLEPVFVAGCLVIGVICGLGGRVFAWSQTRLQHLARRSHPLLRVGVASLLLGLLAWAGHALAGTWITLGPGHIAADWL